MLGSNLAGFYDLFCFHDDGLAGHGHHGVEVVGGTLVVDITHSVHDGAADQSDVAAQGGLQQVVLAVNMDDLLTIGNVGADAGGGQHTAQAKACAADTFSKGALGDQMNFQCTLAHLTAGLGVQADVGGVQSLDSMLCDHFAEAAEAAGVEVPETISALTDLHDLAVFAKENYGTKLASIKTNDIAAHTSYEWINDYLSCGVVKMGAETPTVVNIYETQEWLDLLHMLYDLNEEGLLDGQIAYDTEYYNSDQ